jgi:hypothetical protein
MRALETVRASSTNDVLSSRRLEDSRKMRWTVWIHLLPHGLCIISAREPLRPRRNDIYRIYVSIPHIHQHTSGVCVCMYVCLYIHSCTCMHEGAEKRHILHIRTYVCCMYVQYIHLRARRSDAGITVCMYICMYVCMYVCIYIYT